MLHFIKHVCLLRADLEMEMKMRLGEKWALVSEVITSLCGALHTWGRVYFCHDSLFCPFSVRDPCVCVRVFLVIKSKMYENTSEEASD